MSHAEETLTAEERDRLTRRAQWQPSTAKLLRLYDAALARAGAEEKRQANAEDLLQGAAQSADNWEQMCEASESRLAEATALLDALIEDVRTDYIVIVHTDDDSTTDALDPEQIEDDLKAIRAALSGSTPAQAAECEPDPWQDKHAALAERMTKLAEAVGAMACAKCPALESRIAEATTAQVTLHGMLLDKDARIAQLEAKQLSPAALAEFEGGKAQRDLLRTRIDQAVAELEKACDMSGNRWSEWGSRAESVGELMDSALAILRGGRTSALRFEREDNYHDTTQRVVAAESRLAEATALLERCSAADNMQYYGLPFQVAHDVQRFLSGSTPAPAAEGEPDRD